MSMRTPLALLVCLASLAVPPPAGADSGFRCQTGRLVSLGDRAGEVLDRCGEPDGISQRVERRKIKHRFTRWVGSVQESVVEEQEIEVPIEEWTYDLGRQALVRYVSFENGFVIHVATGKYGTK
jgi:hypothetical protein